ncbi:MAG: hypothetical protein K2N44_19990 [Lachnospiraceae bacterium]|nr:hypothetical protein [Lachnospiraceae bacterium]
MEEPVIAGETTEAAAPVSPEDLAISLNEPVLMEEINIDSLEIPEAPDLEIPDLEIPDLDLSDLDLPDIVMPEEELGIMEAETTGEPSSGSLEMADTEWFEELEAADADSFGEPQMEALGTKRPDMKEQDIVGFGINDINTPDMSDTGEELSLEDIDMPGSEDELKLEDIEIAAEEPFQGSELSIEGLDQAIQSETELQMAGELNIDEFEFDNISAESEKMGTEMSDLSLLDDSEEEKDASISMDDNLEDVLNMLDDDAELAEINDMLKKSDNNEPIQDDMMDLLHQMADDEAASVNAGIQHVDDEDDGVPLPEIPVPVSAATQDDTKKKEKKEKKAAARKKKGDNVGSDDAGMERTKEPGKLGKFFNLLTEEFVPEPTEEELAAEKEAKEAKKQENLTKKEEEKLAKQEAKKAKAEEKAAANRVKQEAAAQKKKEKLAKKEAKKAKLAAEGPKKRIPPKKIAAAVAFGASVGGAVVLSTNVLSAQGFLQTARNAYYDGDYKTVYEATYGMDLDDRESDGLIKARSEVIFKVQRRYDSYQTNVKMGREVEALDALLRGLAAYDTVNADAERYGVMAEVDAIKANILNTLESKYGLDEAEARGIINNQDALSYTIALNDIIAGN